MCKFESGLTSKKCKLFLGRVNLGNTKIKLPSVMINILGEEGHEGHVKYEALTESMAIEGVKIHLYGKK